MRVIISLATNDIGSEPRYFAETLSRPRQDGPVRKLALDGPSDRTIRPHNASGRPC